MPHWQPSAPQALARVASHAAQVTPPVPQAEVVPGLRQELPEQQPAQVAGSQEQAPPTQCRPAPHTGLLPQRHPPVEQLSAVTALQLAQVAPPVPHWARLLPARQVLPLQQPAQEVESQRHAPPEHTWPLAHAAPLPHWHPLLPQLSARVALQAEQVTPPVPQAEVVPGSRQLVPEQQPAQVSGSQVQAPLVQISPAPQGALVPQRQLPLPQLSAEVALQVPQVPPAVPQAETVLPGLHWLPLQQPPAQLVESQTQVPVVQAWPVAQAWLLPHWHWPLTHESETVAPQVLQAAPPMPQADTVLPA